MEYKHWGDFLVPNLCSAVIDDGLVVVAVMAHHFLIVSLVSSN